MYQGEWDIGKFNTDAFQAFREMVDTSDNYAEYGIGASTVFAARNSSARIRAVETDPLWVEKVRGEIGERAEIIHADLGPVGKLGRPLSYDKASNLDLYLDGPFDGGFSPDLVLIDGRFRVACFLSALLNSAPGTRLIFDDYHRGWYQVVERILTPTKKLRRQGVFERPKTINENAVRELREQFRFVMD